MDVSSDLRNVDTRVPPHHRLSVRPHQKLFKVPLDVARLHRLPEQSASRAPKAVSNWGAGALQGRKHMNRTEAESEAVLKLPLIAVYIYKNIS